MGDISSWAAGEVFGPVRPAQQPFHGPYALLRKMDEGSVLGWRPAVHDRRGPRVRRRAEATAPYGAASRGVIPPESPRRSTSCRGSPRVRRSTSPRLGWPAADPGSPPRAGWAAAERV